MEPQCRPAGFVRASSHKIRKMDDPEQNRARRWGAVLFVLLFLTVWLYGMTISMIAGQCRNGRYDSDRLVKSCSTWIKLASPLDVLTTEYRKASGIYLERGIHHALLGNNEAAKADFREARARERHKTGSRAVPELVRRLALETDPAVEELWQQSFTDS